MSLLAISKSLLSTLTPCLKKQYPRFGLALMVTFSLVIFSMVTYGQTNVPQDLNNPLPTAPLQAEGQTQLQLQLQTQSQSQSQIQNKKQIKNTSQSVSETTPLPNQAPQKADTTSRLELNLEYPELMVIPRASERLANEIKTEEQGGFFYNWPLAISSLGLITTSQLASSGAKASLNLIEKDEFSRIQSWSTLIGGAGLGLALYSHKLLSYQSNLAAQKQASKSNNPRAQIALERQSEEILEMQAYRYNIIRWTYLLTNVTMAAMHTPYLDDSKKLAVSISGLLTTLPLFFKPTPVYSYQKHLEYKHKIYRPITSLGWAPTAQNGQWMPQAQLTWVF